jgi:hypothetical protein
MKLESLHLLMSYRCIYECDHCFVHSSPRAGGTMTLAFAKEAIRQAREIEGMRDICFEGGEPVLFYPILLAAARYATESGLGVDLVTNGYFATSVDDAVEYLEPFAELPGMHLSISEDTYHGCDNGDNPAARVREAAERIGIACGAITIEEPCGVSDGHDKGLPILGGGVRFRGRAVEALAEDPTLPRKPWREFTECPDEDWADIRRLHLDGYGNLFACQGIVVGNLSRRQLHEVIDSYHPERNPVIGPLMRGGPAELVRTYGLPFDGEYLDACHLCYLARKALLARFPDTLTPPVVYGVDEQD